MCGIFGSINIKQNNFEKDAIKSIKHRGPDDDGFIKDKNVILGMTRLSIIDLETGAQPISNEKQDIFIVCNGEIYNYLEIKEELKNKVSFKTNSDVECILKLYELYSFKCLEKISDAKTIILLHFSGSSNDSISFQDIFFIFFVISFITFKRLDSSFVEFALPIYNK